jgi:predicted Zn finger-like uncharacterized protein
MNLATRCTACRTVFKVQQDQLHASDGWVRCGRCNEVFKAQDALDYLEKEVVRLVAESITDSPEVMNSVPAALRLADNDLP